MDRDNIIVPTDNLEDLEKDYQEWLMLPMKFKLLSNSSRLSVGTIILSLSIINHLINRFY